MVAPNHRARSRRTAATRCAALLGLTVLALSLVPTGPPAPAPAVPPPGPPRGQPHIIIVTCCEGLSPEETDARVTRPVERALAHLGGVSSSVSRSAAGVSVVRLTLHPDSEPAVALAGAGAMVQAARPDLPPGCDPPLVRPGDPAGARIVGLVSISTSTLPEVEATRLARAVEHGLARLPGVLVPGVLGGRDREISVDLDPQRLEAHGVARADVARALRAATAAPRGMRFGQFPVFAPRPRLAELGDTPVRQEAGRVVFLRDVIRRDPVTDRPLIEVGGAAASSWARVDGRRAVCVPMLAAGTTGPAPDEVRAAVERARARLPGETDLRLLPCGGADADGAEVTVYLRAPSGLRLEETERRVAAVEEFVSGIIPAAEREWVASEVGVRPDPSAAYSWNAAPHDATIRVRLGGRRTRPAAGYASRLREAFGKEERFADLTAWFRSGPFVAAALWGPVADLSIRIRGGSADERAVVADRVCNRVVGIGGVAAARPDRRGDSPRVLIDVDRAKAAAVGLSAADVLRQVTDAGDGPERVGPLVDPVSGESLPVAIRYPYNPLRSVEDLGLLRLTVGGKPVRLDAVAALRETVGPVVIDRADGEPVLDVLLDTGGAPPAALIEVVGQVIRDERLPAGVSLELLRPAPGAAR